MLLYEKQKKNFEIVRTVCCPSFNKEEKQLIFLFTYRPFGRVSKKLTKRFPGWKQV